MHTNTRDTYKSLLSTSYTQIWYLHRIVVGVAQNGKLYKKTAMTSFGPIFRVMALNGTLNAFDWHTAMTINE